MNRLLLCVLCLLSMLMAPIDSPAQWSQTSLSLVTVRGFGADGGNYFAASNNGFFVSTDLGENWNFSNTGLPTANIADLVVVGGSVYVGTDLGVFRSTDAGANWDSASAGLPSGFVLNLEAGGGSLYAAVGGRVYKSTDDGASWNVAATGLPFPTVIYDFAFSGSDLYAASDVAGVYRSTDNGGSWTATGSSAAFLRAIAASGTDLFIGASVNGGVLRSTDNGANWSAVNNGLGNLNIADLATVGGNVFAGTAGGVYLTTDNGASWVDVNSGLTDSSIQGLGVIGSDLFAGTIYGAWKRALSDITTSVNEAGGAIPADFALDQNYPNPFNASTTIRFNAPGPSTVSIRVYDVLGRLVDAPVAGESFDGGAGEIRYNADRLPSGVYHYRLEAVPVGMPAGTVVITRTMMLMK